MKHIILIFTIILSTNLSSQTHLSYYFGDNTNFDESIPVHVRLMTTRGGAWPERRTHIEWATPCSEI